MDRSPMADRTCINIHLSTHRDLREQKPDGWTWDAYLLDMLDEYESEN